MLMSATLVVLLSSLAIRRSLIPIDALMNAARKVAHRQFDHRVEVRSRDEFQDLAEAFNRMADQLDKHIKALVARSDLDRAILSLLDTEQIIDTILRHLQVYFPCQTGAISVLDPESANQGRTYYHRSVADATLRADVFSLDPGLVKQLSCGSPWLRIDRPEGPWQFLQEVRPPQADHFVVLPVVINGRLTALVSLVVDKQTEYTPADLEQAGQLVHHLAVAISNADLIRELKALNMGTLNALARTVDAKSPWTAGHSERVMQVALRIGDAMGLSAEQLFDIRRASLLHDIGKIGVPARILDKTDTLTPEEYQIIKTHPSSGARILKPITAYQKLIPYIEQHHERYDGQGYPKGLAAEQIEPAARIIALADAFDAMISDRPYRKGLPPERVHQIIHREAGLQFDPLVVEAFERIFPRSASAAEGQNGCAALSTVDAAGASNP